MHNSCNMVNQNIVLKETELVLKVVSKPVPMTFTKRDLRTTSDLANIFLNVSERLQDDPYFQQKLKLVLDRIYYFHCTFHLSPKIYCHP